MFCSGLAILEGMHPHVPVIHSARDPFSASSWPLIYSTCGLKPGPQSGDHTLAHTKASGHVNLPPPGPQHPNDLIAKVIGQASPGRYLEKTRYKWSVAKFLAMQRSFWTFGAKLALIKPLINFSQ